MSAVRNQHKPTFLWQALLVLLPVLALAVASLWALQRDRAAVEREARERAAESLESLTRELSTRVGVSLALAQLQGAHEQRWLFASAQWRVSQDPKLLFSVLGDSPGAIENAGRLELVSQKEGPLPDLFFYQDGRPLGFGENLGASAPTSLLGVST